MTNTNPLGGSTAVAVGETVSTDSPKIELGKSKAIIAGAGGVVVALSTWFLTGALDDGALSLNEGIGLALAILGGLGVPGIGAYVVPTKVTGARG